MESPISIDECCLSINVSEDSSGLSENGPCRLIYFNISSSVGKTAWEELWAMALLEGMSHLHEL